MKNKKDETRATLTRWFNEGTLREGMEDFSGVLVYAKTPNTRNWKMKIALAAGEVFFNRAKVGDPMSAGDRPWNWDKAVLIGKATTLEEALTLIGLPDPISHERRKFTDEFGVGDKVSVIRTKHGWHDGEVSGTIVGLSANNCHVQDSQSEDVTHEIRHARDISLIEKAGPIRHSKKSKKT